YNDKNIHRKYLFAMDIVSIREKNLLVKRTIVMDNTSMNDTMTEQTQQDESPFLFRGEALALDLVNTEAMKRGKRRDLLETPQDVARWWQEACEHHSEWQDVLENENAAPVGI